MQRQISINIHPTFRTQSRTTQSAIFVASNMAVTLPRSTPVGALCSESVKLIKMATARDRKAWTIILELYHKEYPHLWDKSNSMYNNKNMRNEAYEVLTRIYRENFDLNASVETLKKKLENMRTAYFRELKKVKESMQSGAGEVYEPSLWYFEKLNFLAAIYEPSGRYSTNNRRSAVTDPLKTEDTTVDYSSSDNEHEPSTSTQERETINHKRKEHTKNQKIIVFKKHVNQTCPDPVSMKNEEWEIMGRSIGLQLRDISSKQLTIASKLISDTIYFARLNRLTEESHVDIGTPPDATVCAMCAGQVGD